MPKEYAGSLSLPAEEFTQAIQRVSQFADERSSAVRLKAENNQFHLSSSSVEMGESEEILDTKFDGKPLRIGFNSRYLIDFMKVAGTEKVNFYFNDAATAAEFRPEGRVDSEYTYRYVVMPMRT